MAEARMLLPEVDTLENQELPQRRTQRRLPSATALVTLAVLTLGSLALARGAGKEPRVLARGPLGDEVTELEENACDRYPYLKYEVPNAIVNNNLANKGPDRNGEGIVYKTIDLGRGAGRELDKEVYMTVNATSSDYQPFSPRLNGMQGKYGSINLNSGSSVDLHFNFYDRETMEKLTMSEFAITWFDLDTGSAGKSAEFVTIGGFQSYHLTDSTEVKVEQQPDGRTKFSGTTTGTGEDNPKDPMFLTQQQKNRAVTLLYGPTSSLDVTIGATAGSGPRFFTFVGRPSLLCAVTVQQNFKPPLPDLTFAPPMERGIMSKEGETFVSFAVKKGDTVKEGDLIATTQKEGEAPTEHRAPFDGTVTQIQDKLKPGDELDLRLSEKILAVVERPSLKPLLQNKEEGVVGGGPGQEAELPSHAVFKRYLVAVGDSVSEGTPIAVVEKHQGGGEVQVKATGYGTVKERQEAMTEGTLLQSVPDGNLVTLGPYKALGPLGEDNVASGKVPEGEEGLTFEEFHVKKGDVVKAGDPIATVKDQDGQEKVISATHGGVITELQNLEPGSPIDRVEDGNLCTTGKFAPLPLEPGVAPLDVTGAAGAPAAEAPATDAGEESTGTSPAGASSSEGEKPLPEQDKVDPEGLKFVRYYAKPGDVVETGDPIAQVEDKDGGMHDILAPRPGVVKRTQEGLQRGMVLEDVLQDSTLATLGKLPMLEISPSERGNFAPKGEESWQLKEWRVAQGDKVTKGDPIALLENPATGETKEVVAVRSGEVTETLGHLKPGDPVEESTGDDDLATISLAEGPDVGFREMGVQVPDMDCTFKDWKVEEGQYVHFGDPIAEVQLPTSSGTGHDRRMASDIFTVPSPGSGWVSYMADLKPGQKISEQAANPTIAKVNLGWPWWLTLLLALCALCCCFACLYRVMQKQPAYKAMPPVAAPALEPEPVKPAPKPEGLRLDFADQGTVRTVYAKYKPLGIKHNHTAPIVAHDFTINSYAKQALGVQPDWKLTRIGDEELNESQDFDAVNERLSRHMKDFPIWPLPLEFRKNPEDAETHVYKFTERPLGMEFSNVAPIKVDRVYKESPAAMQNVEVGWFLTKIGDFDVHENHNFREVLKHFKEGVQGLADEGNRYTEDQ